jgi:hypothetical protein
MPYNPFCDDEHGLAVERDGVQKKVLSDCTQLLAASLKAAGKPADTSTW